jgi:hypothetical protein
MAGYNGMKGEGEGSQGDKPDETTVEGTLCLTFSARGKTEAEAQRQYLEAVDRLGYKLGVRVRNEQTIRSFLFRRDGGDIALAEDADVSADLQRVLSPPPGEKWLGFVPRSRERRRYTFPEVNVVCYEFFLVLAPPPPLPLIIPIVIRHNNGRSFGESFIAGLLVLRARARRT